MLFVYSCLLYLLMPYFLLRLWWKGRSLPAYRQRILERFYWGLQKQPVDIWLHAVSLGEVIAACPLIDAMLAKQWTVLVTTMTPTGSECVQARFADKVFHQYLPYDLPGVLKRFFRATKPKVGIIMETELWPNVIYQAKSAKVPLILANARLSESSFSGYKTCKLFFKPLLNQFTTIFAQTNEDAERFMALGVPDNLVCVLGNIKFDSSLPDIENAQFQTFKQLWGENRVVVIIASTHEGEENQILVHLKKLQQAIPGLLLLIAPRHPERFQAVYQLALSSGFNTGLRSDSASISKQSEVVVLDSLGELLGFYQLSHYAFVGGSLVPVGGHNVLEPIAMGVPVISGKNVGNFKAICTELVAAKGIVLVDNASELVDEFIRLHVDKRLQEERINNAKRILEINKGTMLRLLHCIEQVKVTC